MSLNQDLELEPSAASRRLLRLPAVQAALGGMHKTTLYALIRDGRFPPPIKIGGASRWVADEIQAFINERMQEGRGPVPRCRRQPTNEVVAA